MKSEITRIQGEFWELLHNLLDNMDSCDPPNAVTLSLAARTMNLAMAELERLDALVVMKKEGAENELIR